jgi:Domain of unknown function (DUF4129)
VIRRLPPSAPLLFGVAVVLLVAVLSATGESAVEVGRGWVPALGQEPEAPAAEAPPERDEEFVTPPVLRTAATFGLVALLSVMALMLLVGLASVLLSLRFGRLRRRSTLWPIGAADPTDEGTPIDVDLMRRAADGALDRLRERAGEPGDAVVLAWLALERAAADSGLARQPHQTPSEFTTVVLAGLNVNGDALDRLRRLYQRARFSTHPVTTGDVQAAQEALHRVITDLRAGTTMATTTATAVSTTGSPR